MPSKAAASGKPKAMPAKSRELVPVGPREVFKAHHGRQRDSNGHKPLTARALVLRNGKYGAMGTGEVVLATRMSGREKLDLLAEELMRQAIVAPFKLYVCLKIADSQLSAYLDELNAFQDPEFFNDRIKTEVASHMNLLRLKELKDPEKMKAHVMTTLASHIHNTYMFASGWRVVGDIIRELIDYRLDDATVKSQLRSNADLRSCFLALYDMVNVLVQAAQSNFGILASAARHYSQYFKISIDPETQEEEYAFDWVALKSVHKSFLDSIVVELCLPSSPIPKQILYQLLGEAIEESPKDRRNFSQAVWDAVGDLSTIVELQSMLESVLLGPEGEEWKKESHNMPEAYEQWTDAQVDSQDASKYWSTYAELVYPLEKTKSKSVLDSMWAQINHNYQSICGKTPDELWHVDDIRNIEPSWHGGAGRGRDGEDVLALVPAKEGKAGRNKKPLAITDGHESDGHESNDSMPTLQTVSESDEDNEEFSDEDERDTDLESEGSADEYDEEEGDELRELLREAMDTAVASPDFYNSKGPAPEFDALAEERKNNPFLKLLGSLRGRMFSASPALKTTTRTQPRQPFPGKKIPMPGKSGTVPKAGPAPATSTVPQRPHQTTVEEVEDEEAPSGAAKKKKKKHKKKKKPAATTATENGAAAEPSRASESAAEGPSTSSPARPATPKTQAKASPTAAAKPMPPRASFNSSTTTLPFGSTTSLPLPTEQTAQSAHKYLQTEGLTSGKTKVKTRAAVGNLSNLDGIPEKVKRKSFWSAFSKKRNKEAEESESEDEGAKDKKGRWAGLNRRTSALMHQLLRTSEDKTQGLADMRWEKFVKLMEDMGFTYHPGTAGSSVRFDPPNPKDRSICFHKPHPDPTIHPMKLRDFANKLKRYYGWDEDEFLAATQKD